MPAFRLRLGKSCWKKRRDERRLLEEQTASRALEQRVAGLAEVGRQSRVAAAVDGLVRDFLEEGLVAELDLGRGELLPCPGSSSCRPGHRTAA